MIYIFLFIDTRCEYIWAFHIQWLLLLLFLDFNFQCLTYGIEPCSKSKISNKWNLFIWYSIWKLTEWKRRPVCHLFNMVFRTNFAPQRKTHFSLSSHFFKYWHQSMVRWTSRTISFILRETEGKKKCIYVRAWNASLATATQIQLQLNKIILW